MAAYVYVLCALTSLACTFLLVRGYVRGRTPYALWSSFCFVGFTLNNALLFVDFVLIPQMDLSVIRLIPAVLGLSIMAVGFILDSK